MPLKGFKHPLTREKVGFDAFDDDTSRKGRAAFQPWMARLLGQKEADDIRHSTLDLTATRSMGCPRQVFIETLFDYWIDPDKLALRARGTALHEVATSHFNPEIWYSETHDRERCTLDGLFGGYQISMLADAFKKDLSEIVDLKFPSDFSIRYRSPKARPDNAIQLNLARHLLAQQEWAVEAGYDPDTVLLTIWDNATSPQEGPLAREAPHMEEDEMLEHKPGGGDYTVGEILEVYAAMQELYKEAGSPTDLAGKEKVASQLPLIGAAGMFNGKKCDSYCDVEPICTDLVRRFGEPTIEWEDASGESRDDSGAGAGTGDEPDELPEGLSAPKAG